ncbi:heat shock factor protein 5 [Myxocyprinus asiaticus]|uniref:heat shock factor protein 5 n=1 Tax=Myxocyprinus asiaticus TaxID=70543 RepID=UPI0022233883|nr:heat shock factor protein 5 [Myxocyprinus asiaticus]
MEFDQSLLSVPINHNNFPAKLWRLANDPNNRSVVWNLSGDGVIIDQQRFETELLSPVKQEADVFKTNNFTSFIRQLNLYGFRKVFDGLSKDKHPSLHHFHNPNFKLGRPELLVNLKRLTISNKAKIQAGEKVTCRAPPRVNQQSEHNEKRGSAQPYQYHGTESHQVKKGYDRTPIPSRSWNFRHSDVPPFYAEKGIPVSVIRRYQPDTLHGIQPSTSAVFRPQEPKYIPHPSTYTPAFYLPVVCQCCTPGYMEANRAGGDQASLSYSHYGYYPNYTMSYPHNSIQTPEWGANNTLESKRSDVNLDRVFQMVDEFQSLPNVHIVKVGTPVKAQHMPASSEPSTSTLYTSSAASKPESASLQSSTPNTVTSSSVSGVNPSGSVGTYFKLESEEHKIGKHEVTGKIPQHVLMTSIII